jgi:hypothetical protein
MEYGPVDIFYEHGNESSGVIKGAKFLDQLSGIQLVKKGSDPWSQYWKFVCL